MKNSIGHYSDVKIFPPNLINHKWRWEVNYEGKILNGKANSEPEAWRLANDALLLLEERNKALRKYLNRFHEDL